MDKFCDIFFFLMFLPLGLAVVFLIFVMLYTIIDMTIGYANLVESIKRSIEKKEKRKIINKRKAEIINSIGKTDNIKIEVLRYEYSDYIEIVNNIIDKMFYRSKISVNELYLFKLHENFNKVKPDIHSIEGIACLYNAVMKTPVICESNYNVTFINELLSYNIPEKYLYYNLSKIDILCKEKVLQKCLDDCMNKEQQDIYEVAYFLIKKL